MQNFNVILIYNMNNKYTKYIGLQSYNESIGIYENNFNNICPGFDIYPTIISHKRRVIAIGDIHGDMNLAINFLKAANLIKEIENEFFHNKKIYEYKYTFRVDSSEPLKLNQRSTTDYNEISSHIKNQFDLVYRYYECDKTFYVKIVQEDNNPKHKHNPKDKHNNEDSDISCTLDNNRWFEWIGLDTHVVQVGDQIDRCRPHGQFTCDQKEATINDEDSDLEIMLFYDSLDKIARKSGGRLFSLLGNHEIMNITGDMRYASYKGNLEYSPEPKDFDKGNENRKIKFNSIIKRKMACTRSTILAIGDYLFVHGGIAYKLAFQHNLLDINSIIRNFLYGSIDPDGTLNKLLYSSKSSPLWYRKLAYIPPDNGKQHKTCHKYVDPLFKQINEKNKELYKMSSDPNIKINGMIIGHTPQFTVFGKGITTACNNRIIRADIGASTAFDVFSDNLQDETARLPQVVEILYDQNTGTYTVNILIYNK